MSFKLAPDWDVSEWFNTPAPLTLQDLRGRVVLFEAFQMLCPGCISDALPQAKRVASTFDDQDVVVVGLHTVFEHHAAQGNRDALAVFLLEYRITFPVGVDRVSTQLLPITMAAYKMQGTPTQILIDRNGYLRKQQFGPCEDLKLGAEIMALLRE